MAPTPRRRYRRLHPAVLAGDPDAAHRLRRLARRLTAQLRVAGAPGGVRHIWRDVRRAVSDLRDHDVTGPLILRALGDLKVPEPELAAVRTAWEERRTALLAALNLPRSVPAARPVVKGKRWRRAVRQAARRILATEPPPSGRLHVQEWHAWRKALKRYRAVLELREDAPPALLRLLQVLGDAQDAQTVLDLVPRTPVLAPYRAGLGRAARAWRHQARRAAWPLWTELRTHLEAVGPLR